MMKIISQDEMMICDMYDVVVIEEDTMDDEKIFVIKGLEEHPRYNVTYQYENGFTETRLTTPHSVRYAVYKNQYDAKRIMMRLFDHYSSGKEFFIFPKDNRFGPAESPVRSSDD